MTDSKLTLPSPELLTGGRAAPRASRRRLVAWYIVGGVVAVLGFLVPLVLRNVHWLDVLGQGLVLGVAATGVGILVRQTGLVNFGAGAVFGGGAYLYAIAVLQLQIDMTLAFLLAMVGITVMAFLVGIITVRTGHLQFAILTIAFASLLVQFVLTQFARPVTGAADGKILQQTGTFFGLSAKAMFQASTFWPVAWAAILIAVAVAIVVERSKLGRIARAIQENEERMLFAGYRVLWPKVAVFTIAGALGGLAGALTAMHYSFVSPSLLDISSGGSILVAALVGGPQSAFGPAIGAILYAIGEDAFGAAGRADLLTGIGIIAAIVLLRRGFVGLIEDVVKLIRRGVAKTRKGSSRAEH